MKIALGMPTNRLVKPKTAESILNLVVKTKYEIEPIVSTRGYNTSENRNYIASQAIKRGCTHLFFADDDMIFEEETLNVLMSFDKDIIGGVYRTKYEVQDDVCEYFDNRRDGVMKVKAIGTGCLLIKTDVFKKLKTPWFKYEWHPNGMVKRSHDWIFCEDARKAGYDIWANRNLDIKHIGLKNYENHISDTNK